MSKANPSTQENSKVRLDKWLWAARFFKTRNMAKQAIEGGKVHFNGSRCKVSKEVQAGDVLTIRLGWDEKEIKIVAISDQRRGAPEAQRLYQETASSIEQRAVQSEQRRAMRGIDLSPVTKPNKRDRRKLQAIKKHDEF